MVKVLPRFRDLIPPLSTEEREQLEANLVADGCRDPLVVWNGYILDGHNRHEICERRGIKYTIFEIEFATEDDAAIWIIRNQFGRRNLTTYTRGELALKLEPLISTKAKANNRAGGGDRKSPCQKSDKAIDTIIDTKKEIAKVAGVSHDTIAKIKFIQQHADEATKEQLRTRPDMKVHRVAKELKEKQQRQTRQGKRLDAAKGAPPDDGRIIVGDFRHHADKVADGSVSLIFTDPPYDREASKMLPDLAEFAERKLAEGGSLIMYVGQTQIPTALDAIRPKLRYWWTIACVHAGRSTVMREYGINAGWKAVLWFVKKTRDDNSIMVSDVMSGGEEKTHHDWQQSKSEAVYWIDKLCPIDGLVCDPFLGGGTTAAAAQSLNRRWIGFEIDKENAAISRKRVNE